MQSPEASTQPFQFMPCMSCKGQPSECKCNSGKGSGLAHCHDSRSAANICTPAFRALLAPCMFNGWLDELADQQRLHTHCVSTCGKQVHLCFAEPAPHLGVQVRMEAPVHLTRVPSHTQSPTLCSIPWEYVQKLR